MTYGLTVDGLIKKPLLSILSDIEDYQLENVSSELTRDRLSVIGYLNTGNAQEIAELWEVALAVYTNMFRDGASGISLQYVAALTGTYVEEWSYTTVTAQVTLNPNKSLPAGSIANLSGQPNVRFLTLTEVPADPSGGTFDVVFQAENPGAISVAVGQLDEISVAVSGWTSVDNTAAGSTGTQPETDSELRVKAEQELGSQGTTTLNAIYARINRYTDVTMCAVYENDCDIVNEYLIPPHHILLICLDGTAQTIAEQLFEHSKAAGIGTYGQVETTVTDSQGYDHIIRHDWAIEYDIDVAFAIAVEDGYELSSVVDEVTDNLTDYINSLQIGEDVLYDAIRCIVFNTDGVASISNLDLEGGSSDVVIAFNEKAIPDSIGWGS